MKSEVIILSVFTILQFLAADAKKEFRVRTTEVPKRGAIEKYCSNSENIKVPGGDELNKTSSAYLYNFALCLNNNDHVKTSHKVFSYLLNHIGNKEIYGGHIVNENGFIVKKDVEPTRGMVVGQLVLIYAKLSSLNKTDELLQGEMGLYIEPATQKSLTLVLDSLYIISPNLPNYSFRTSYGTISMYLDDRDSKSLEFNGVLLNENIVFPPDVQKVDLYYVKFIDDEGVQVKNYNIGHLLGKSLTELRLRCDDENGERKLRSTNADLSVPWKRLKLVEYLNIAECMVILNSNKISPKILVLENVIFANENQEILEDFFANGRIDFSKAEQMSLTSNKNATNIFMHMNKLSVDKRSWSVELEYLKLRGQRITVIDWENAAWTIDSLVITEIPFLRKNQLVAKNIYFQNADVDISVLPQSITTLSIDYEPFAYGNKNASITCTDNSRIFPYLKFITLDSTFTPCFSNSEYYPSLAQIRITNHAEEPMKLNVNFIPKGLDVLALQLGYSQFENKFKVFGDQPQEINQLTLISFTLEDIIDTLPKFRIAYAGAFVEEFSDKLVDVIQYPLKETVVCSSDAMSEKDFQNSLIAQYVDRNSDCYIIRNRTGKAVDWNDRAQVLLVNKRVWAEESDVKLKPENLRQNPKKLV